MALLVSGWARVLGGDRLCGHIVVGLLFGVWEFGFSLLTHICVPCPPFHSLLPFRICRLWWWFAACLHALILGLLGKMNQTANKGWGGFLLKFEPLGSIYPSRCYMALFGFYGYLVSGFQFVMLRNKEDTSLCTKFINKSFDLYSLRATERCIKL